VEFKPQLEKILKEVSLISQLAFIAEETEALAESGVAFDPTELSAAGPKGAEHMGLHSGAVDFDVDDASENSKDDDSCSMSADLHDSPAKYCGSSTSRRSRRVLKRTSSGDITIKESLDRWEEPRNKADKVSSRQPFWRR